MAGKNKTYYHGSRYVLVKLWRIKMMLLVKSMHMCVRAGAEEDLAVHSGAE